MEKRGGNRYELLLVRLDKRGNFFTHRTVSHGDKVPRDVGDSPTRDIFKILLDRVLGHLV